MQPESQQSQLIRWQQHYLKKQRRQKYFTGILMAVAFVAVFVCHAFVIQPYRVDGSSMEPTLSHNDRLLVFKLGRSWSKITKKQYVPKRGEIIVFQNPITQIC